MSTTGEEVSKKMKEVETVTMSDGRKVDFVGKRKLLKDTVIGDGQVSVRLDFRNGETRLFPIPQELLLQFAGHGAEQKLGDETAGVEDVDDMVLGIDDMIERLNKGEWSVKREGSGMAGTSVLLRALMEVSGKTVEQVKAFLAGKTQMEKLALRNADSVKPVVERIEAEKVSKASKVDTAALLGELG